MFNIEDNRIILFGESIYQYRKKSCPIAIETTKRKSAISWN